MVRSVTTAMATALTGNFSRFLLIQADLDAGTERYAFAPLDIDWDGHTWSGIALPIAVTEMRETDSGEATGVQIQFLQVNEAVIADALQNSIRRKKITIWLGALDDAGQVVADPVQTFSGYGDAISIKYDAESNATVTWAIESYEALWSRTAGGRLTDAEHQARHPGDKIFSLVADAAKDQAVVWPAKSYWRGY